jgi:hypothetical protein
MTRYPQEINMNYLGDKQAYRSPSSTWRIPETATLTGAGTRPVRVVGDEYGGDVDYTRIGAQTHRRLLVTDPLILTPVASSKQEHTDRRKEWIPG